MGSTDYLPGHSELLTIASPGVVQDTTNPDDSDINVVEKIQWPHNGTIYPLTEAKHAGISRLNLGFSSIETRAPVGLLSRNIKVVSDDTLGAVSWPAAPGAFFGGHAIFRQGFAAVQVQGVEFYQLGQGGRIGHYPVHFHLARKVPLNTFVSDSSIWDSMSRWIVLHGTQGVTLQRDVGYLSIGHGFYLEDATETNNKLYGDLGVFARAAVLDPANVPLAQQHNPRQVPGILASPFPTTVDVPCGPNTCACNVDSTNRCGTPQEQVPYHSDVDHPSVFWITNGWNDFEYNMADGAGTCGFCYWLTPAYIGGHSRMVHWEGYAAEQRGLARAAMAPLEDFYGNSCSTAMNSFNVVGNTTACSGVVWDASTNLPRVVPVTPDPKLVPTVNAANPRTAETEKHYPNIDMGGGHFGTRCPSGADCATVHKCASGNEANCMVTVLDHYTSSFNWAQTNVAAIWLRPQWNLVLQSALTATCAGDGTEGTNWHWSEDCANNTCYGVPLYRELATGSEKSSRPTLAGIKMMGKSFFQRNTLTVNNGVYYMDTTVAKEKQRNLGAGNITKFQASTPSKPRVYNVFSLFAKPSTTQTYSIYVGPGFDKVNDVKLVRADIAAKKITFTRSDTLPGTWDKQYKDGVLTVTVNMNFPKFITNYNDERMASCRPNRFCTWTGDASTGSCGCNAAAVDYPDQNLINECAGTNDTGLTGKVPLCSWSVADVTCPAGGCYGFSFKMPDGFTMGTKPGLPPAPDCFPQMTNGLPSPWDLPFVPASPTLAGSCFYSQTPSSDFCSPP